MQKEGERGEQKAAIPSRGLPARELEKDPVSLKRQSLEFKRNKKRIATPREGLSEIGPPWPQNSHYPDFLKRGKARGRKRRGGPL